ncbi:AbrB family transcriptional regulator [Chelativorans sp. AA-79]|uniref:AbrB family transcriptional regulator n=1 Tax=Chelativorans sp. AA-79 TaxID=3028735 RepID=UPI0023F7EDE9|nr:AbrB family transcriptional regulator [Chelativorans sp. AA-79]WEX08287.1 AbrB family transcriptional regulator [Chelativorans sp. AA-79]
MWKPADPVGAGNSRLGTGLKFLAALACGTLGGAIFYRLNLPLAWMLGAMTACGIAALISLPIATPGYMRPPMSAVIGSMLGTSFSPEIFVNLPHWIVPLLGLVGFLIVSGAACYFYFRRVVGLDRPTAYFAGMPGGLIDMVILGGEKGGDEKSIALIHAARIFLVVLCLPTLIQLATGVTLDAQSAAYRPWSSVHAEGVFWFAVAAAGGSLLGHLLHLPAKFLIGPMLVSAGLHLGGFTDFVLPSGAVAAAQVVLGATVGGRFVGTAPRTILRILAMSVGSTVILLLITLLFGEAISHFTDVPLEGLLLAYSPGGLAEMSLVAFALGLEVPFVVAHHMARVFLVIAGASLLFRFLPQGQKGGRS